MSEPAQDQRVKIGGSPVRCPYCHDDVDPEQSEWVACAGCLARHHQACWDEGSSCSACGAADSLIQVKAKEKTATRLATLDADVRDTRPHPLLGGPTRVVLERTFEGEATIEDAAWLDATVRRAVKIKGRVALEGRSLVWSPHGDNGCKSTTLRVSLTSKEGKTTLRLEEDLRSMLLGTVLASLGVCLSLIATLGSIALELLLFVPVLVVVLLVADRMLFRDHGERRERLLSDLLERLTAGLTWSPTTRPAPERVDPKQSAPKLGA